MIFPGTAAGVGRAVHDALQQLPSGAVGNTTAELSHLMHPNVASVLDD